MDSQAYHHHLEDMRTGKYLHFGASLKHGVISSEKLFQSSSLHVPERLDKLVLSRPRKTKVRPSVVQVLRSKRWKRRDKKLPTSLRQDTSRITRRTYLFNKPLPFLPMPKPSIFYDKEAKALPKVLRCPCLGCDRGQEVEEDWSAPAEAPSLPFLRHPDDVSDDEEVEEQLPEAPHQPTPISPKAAATPLRIQQWEFDFDFEGDIPVDDEMVNPRLVRPSQPHVHRPKSGEGIRASASPTRYVDNEFYSPPDMSPLPTPSPEQRILELEAALGGPIESTFEWEEDDDDDDDGGSPSGRAMSFTRDTTNTGGKALSLRRLSFAADQKSG